MSKVVFRYPPNRVARIQLLRIILAEAQGPQSCSQARRRLSRVFYRGAVAAIIFVGFWGTFLVESDAAERDVVGRSSKF